MTDPLATAIKRAIAESAALRLVRIRVLQVAPLLVSINGVGSVPAVTMDGSSLALDDTGYALISPTTSIPVVLAGAGGGGGGGGGFVRANSTPVVNLVGAATYVTTAIPLAKSFRLLAMSVNAACRVRLFATSAGAAADIGRAVTDDPPDGRGVILDYVAPYAGEFLLSPLVDGSSMEATPVASITTVVDNTAGSTASISVSFDYLPTE